VHTLSRHAILRCADQHCWHGSCGGVFDFFNNQRKLPKVDCPTLLMHGEGGAAAVHPQWRPSMMAGWLAAWLAG
jgi:hypothetical protein